MKRAELTTLISEVGYGTNIQSKLAFYKLFGCLAGESYGRLGPA